MNRSIAARLGAALAAAALVAGCSHAPVQESGVGGGYDYGRNGYRYSRYEVPVGTPFDVRTTSTINSATTQVGDDWEGVLVRPMTVRNHVVLDEGSVVHGVVQRCDPRTGDQRATIELAVTGVEENGDVVDVSGTTDPIVAGTTRAQHIGAIAVGAAAGALLGKAVTGSNKGAVVGGILGGVAGHVLSTRDRDIQLQPGTVITFTVNEPVATRYPR